jgi:hypothetical protein
VAIERSVDEPGVDIGDHDIRNELDELTYLRVEHQLVWSDTNNTYSNISDNSRTHLALVVPSRGFITPLIVETEKRILDIEELGRRHLRYGTTSEDDPGRKQGLCDACHLSCSPAQEWHEQQREEYW